MEATLSTPWGTPPKARFIIHLEPQGEQVTKTRVMGAGVIGASGAYRLTQAGAAVTVLEAMRIGAIPPGISFAWTAGYRSVDRNCEGISQ